MRSGLFKPLKTSSKVLYQMGHRHFDFLTFLNIFLRFPVFPDDAPVMLGVWWCFTFYEAEQYSGCPTYLNCIPQTIAFVFFANNSVFFRFTFLAAPSAVSFSKSRQECLLAPSVEELLDVAVNLRLPRAGSWSIHEWIRNLEAPVKGTERPNHLYLTQWLAGDWHQNIRTWYFREVYTFRPSKSKAENLRDWEGSLPKSQNIFV